MEKEDIIELFPPEYKKQGAELLDNIEFVSNYIKKLKTMELIEVHPTKPQKQRQTAAGKALHDYLQTYQNLLNTLMKLLKGNGEESGEADSAFDSIDELRAMFGL